MREVAVQGRCSDEASVVVSGSVNH